MTMRPRITRTTVAVCAVALTALLGLSACAKESEPPRPSTTGTPGPALPPTPTPTPTEEPDPDPGPTEEPWERFSDPRFAQSFEMPPGWSVDELPGAAAEGPYQLEIVDDEGAVQLHLATGVQGLGGACAEDLETLVIEELDSEPAPLPGYRATTDEIRGAELASPRFVFRASQLDGRVVTSLAVSDDVPQESCMYYNLLHPAEGAMAFADTLQVDSFEPAADPPRTFASMDEARAFAETEEYATLKRILLSLGLE